MNENENAQDGAMADVANQGDADQVNQANQVNQARQPPAFALSPAQALVGIIDMSTAEGRKMYFKAIAPLDNETPYDCNPDGLKGFLDDLTGRATDFGWNIAVQGIVQVPQNHAHPAQNCRNLLTNYGELTLEQIHNYDATYIAGQTRQAQDNYMLGQAIMNSLSQVGKAKVNIWKTQFTINGQMSGNLLLKVLIRESHLDTNATATQIRMELSSLDTYMVTIGSDIPKFNTHVSHLIEGLNARGQTTSDLTTNLYKAYAAASDATFTAYISRKQEEYEDGGTVDDDAHARDLMTKASNKYKNLKMKGIWNAPSDQEEKLLAHMHARTHAHTHTRRQANVP